MRYFIRNILGGMIFLLLLCPIVSGAINTKKSRGWWLLRKDTKATITKAGENGVEITLTIKDGRKVTLKPSDIKRSYGTWATHLVWKKLNENDRLKLLHSYGFNSLFSVKTFKENAKKDFGYKTLTEMTRFGVHHVFYVKAMKEIIKGAAIGRVKIPPEVDEARKVSVSGLPTMPYGIDVTKESVFKEAAQLRKEIKEEMKAIQELTRIMTNLEAKKIYKVFESVTSFTFEQVLSLITGGVYNATQEMSNLTAEIVKEVYSGVSSALNSDMPPDKFIKFCSNLQQSYYMHAKNLAIKLKNHKEKYNKLIEQLMKIAEEKSMEEMKKEEKELTKKTKTLEKKVTIKPVAVKVVKSAKKKISPEKVKAITRALQNKINKICEGMDNRYRSLYREWISDENIKKYQINNNKGLIFPPLTKDEIKSTYSVSMMKRRISDIEKRDIPNMRSAKRLTKRIIEKLSNEADLLPNKLAPINMAVRAWARKGVYIGLNTSCLYSCMRRFAEQIHYLDNIIKNISISLKNLEQNKQALQDVLPKRIAYLKEIQSRWQTLADNYLYSYDAILGSYNEYNKLLDRLGISASYDQKFHYWKKAWFLPYSKKTKEAFKTGDLQKLKEIKNKMEQDISNLEGIYHRGVVAYNYTVERRKRLDSFVSGCPVYEISQAIKDGLLSNPEIVGSYILRTRLGRPKSAEQIYRELDPKKIDPTALGELELVIDMIEDYNEKVSREIGIGSSKFKKAINKLRDQTLIRALPNEYAIYIKNINSLWNMVYTNCSPFNMYSLNISKNVPALINWIAPIPKMSPTIFDLKTKNLRDRCKEISLIHNKWLKRLSKIEEKRKKLAAMPAIILRDSVKVNGKPLSRFYSNIVIDKQQLKDGKIMLSGTVISGYPVDMVKISGDVNGDALLKQTKWTGDKTTTEWEFAFSAKPGTYTINILPERSYYRILRTQGPSLSITIIDMESTYKKRSFTKAIQDMYSDFAQQYMSKNISSLLQYISPDWSAYDGTNIDDLEEILENSFDIFDKIEYRISNLKIRPMGKKHFRVSYDNQIIGSIYSERITHKEGGHVVEEVGFEEGKPIILKTLSGHFWKASR